MPVDVTTIVRVRTGADFASTLTRVARRTAAAEGFTDGQLSIAVVNRRTIAELHRRHLGTLASTDVLTFDLGTDRGRHWLEAEIVVCADVARREAARRLRRAPPLGAAAFRALAGRSAIQSSGPVRGTARYRDAQQCAEEALLLTTAELALYVVHGLLHLAGYDDHDPAGARAMHAREDELLSLLGLGPVYVSGQ